MSGHQAVEELCRLLERLGLELRGGLIGKVESKPEAGLVSEMDRRLETALRQNLLDLWPGSVVVGEEEGGSPAYWTWWVDPLDGTTNCVHGWRRSALSVALYEDGQPLLAAVHDPYQSETFWAVRGEGAWCGDQRLRASTCSRLDDALLCTGFAPQPEAQWSVFRALHGATRGVRVSGCASLDLAYVAAGRVEGYWEVDLKPWDVAAGLLLVSEAGGFVADLGGRPAHLESADFLACAPDLVGPLLAALTHLAP